MITKVYNEFGDLVHDCVEVGCAISWDGYVIIPAEYDRMFQDELGQRASAEPSKHGDPVPDRQDPGAEWELVSGTTARPANRNQ